MKKILCFGDSNTWGHNPVDCSKLEKPWTVWLKDIVPEYEIVSDGVCGRATTHYLENEDKTNGLKDFRERKITESFGEITPNTKGLTSFGNLRNCLPEPVSEAISEGMQYFDTKIKGFNREDTILCGIEARTSSPLRIERDQGFESNIKGIYPCGEGAGFAGGITSAAMDGIKVAQALVTV